MKIFLSFGFVFLSFSVFAQTFNIDIQKSGLKWTGTKLTGTHVGKVNFESGNIVYEAGLPKTAYFVVSMDSISCDDLQGEWSDKLLGHLKGSDFFDVVKFKSSTLSVTKIAKNKNEDDYKFDGLLTIKNKTVAVSFNGKLRYESGELRGNGKLIFDRTKFDIKYNSGKFFQDLGDKLIKDDVELVFDLFATTTSSAIPTSTISSESK